MILLALVLGCTPPPQAPEELDELAAYLFEEQQNEDDEVLRVGLESLQDWFATDWDPEDDDGYLLGPISEASAQSLDASIAWVHPDTKEERTVENLRGVAAGTLGAYTVDDYAEVLIVLDQDIPFDYAEWSREWHLNDPDCFMSRECMFLEGHEEMVLEFALGTRSEGASYNQFRWIELTDGSWALTHRNWQIYPPEVNLNLMEVADQYYLNLFLPASDGGAYRLQATWAVFTGDGVPEDMALNLTVSSMMDHSADMEAWLDGEE